ncbi:NFX1-type zinc finger-containing protein 1 isoform X2 [Antennarius striatus]
MDGAEGEEMQGRSKRGGTYAGNGKALDSRRKRGDARKESKDGAGSGLHDGGMRGKIKGYKIDAKIKKSSTEKEYKGVAGHKEVQESGKRGRADAGMGRKLDSERQKGGVRKESKDGAAGKGVQGRGLGGRASDSGKGCEMKTEGQRSGTEKESKGGTGREKVEERGQIKGSGAADGGKVCKMNAGSTRGGRKGRGRGGEGVKGVTFGARSIRDQGADRRKPLRKDVSDTGVRRQENKSGRSPKRRDVKDKKDKNERRSDFRDKNGVPGGHGLGYKQLEELSLQDPAVVTRTLASQPALRGFLSKTTMKKDLLELLCRVLSKAVASRTDRGALQHLAGMIRHSRFFSTILPQYLADIESESDPGRRAQYPQHVENILAFLSQVYRTFHASEERTLNLLLTQLQSSINSLKLSGVEISPQMEESVQRLRVVMRNPPGRSREGTLRCDFLSTGGEAEQYHFSTIPTCPTAEELHQEEQPPLRPILTSECYTNTHLYLDTNFRLLREDFVQPLRNGIRQLRLYQTTTGKSDGTLEKHFDDVRVYYDTKLLVPQCTHVGVAYIVQFDIQPLRFVRWGDSKRLIYGSLVLLSCDNFKSILFATVSNREVKNLRKGQIEIVFTEESILKLAEYQMDQVFVMVESTAYFEAYRYVLDGLKELNEDNLPFQRYIVKCKTDVEPPAYLQIQDIYDLRSIAPLQYQQDLLPFHSLKETAWPKKEKLGLDKSQMGALQLALTKELAIIQGPPGTGKTYIGLKIAQSLLTNRGLWGNRSGMGPMLVVGYTNHALDQFLEGIYKFLRGGLVRVGGCSASEILKPFNLTELLKSETVKRLLPSYHRRAYKEIYTQLMLEKDGIQSAISKLEYSLTQILPESLLQMFILDRHWNNLNQPLRRKVVKLSNEKRSGLVTEWLCLDSTTLQQRETENTKGNEDKPAAAAAEEEEEERELEEEDFNEIAEEEDLIQEEWIIENDIDCKVRRSDDKKDNMTNAEREMEELMEALNLEEAETQDKQSKEEWEMQREQKKKRNKNTMKELKKTSAMTEDEEAVVLDIWTLNLADRWRLYRLWLNRYRQVLFTRVQESQLAYENTVDRLREVKDHLRICLLRKAKVIGMTTTGAAKYRKILEEVRPRVVIIEEAAQVLEGQTIVTLGQACQHLILIGDHQQLRPGTTVYELAKAFNLETSMFERLVKMGLRFVRLSLQHRMRPEIARLLTPHIYSELENHPSVYDYENIKGLSSNLFFVEHNHPEETVKDGTSYQNKHEAMFVVALCRYLLFQDYKPEQITILTTYRGQLNCLEKLMAASQFKNIRACVVDKYQGEENDIVLLSLVRSNLKGKVGFLSIPNRVCVALSRAKKGLYCIGNSTLLGQVKLWRNIFDTLREKDQVGGALILCCQNHPNRKVRASNAEDFEQAPEGGCTYPCNFRLKCGHVCSKFCHPHDPKHKTYKCVENCQKVICDRGHVCRGLCHAECFKDCPVMVKKVLPQCGHTQFVPCHQDPTTFACQKPCQRLLHDGHPCDSLCGELCTSKCKMKVTSELSCGRRQGDACFLQTDDADDHKCRGLF